MIFVFHQIHPDVFCRPPPLRTTVGHPPTTTHGYAPGSGSIVRHACMFFFFFLNVHRNGFLSFLRSTQMIFADRHYCNPPWVTRYALGSSSIVLHVCVCKGMIFVFHQIHPDDFSRPPPLRTTVGHPPTTTHGYAPGSGSIVFFFFFFGVNRLQERSQATKATPQSSNKRMVQPGSHHPVRGNPTLCRAWSGALGGWPR
jgi:hypothetical protein